MRTAVKWWADDGWFMSAACKGHDPRWWDIRPGKPNHENIKAMVICGACPVVEQCGKSAREQGAVMVIRGGKIMTSNRKGRKR